MFPNRAQGVNNPNGESYAQRGAQLHVGTPNLRDGDYNAALLQYLNHYSDPSLLSGKPHVQLEVYQKRHRYLSWEPLFQRWLCLL
ncbi:hypothetical protein FRC12_019831 [Ceratobasidium sp. 428]|nr:hypothetical protein FRC12_019831 [Ceratobasidium sp. 428]